MDDAFSIFDKIFLLVSNPSETRVVWISHLTRIWSCNLFFFSASSWNDKSIRRIHVWLPSNIDSIWSKRTTGLLWVCSESSNFVATTRRSVIFAWKQHNNFQLPTRIMTYLLAEVTCIGFWLLIYPANCISTEICFENAHHPTHRRHSQSKANRTLFLRCWRSACVKCSIR